MRNAHLLDKIPAAYELNGATRQYPLRGA
ncbi:hypothetical protein A2U01_0107991, partial [Trifolium medium]|nr:hypothetical protein [Trifolium medium]